VSKSLRVLVVEDSMDDTELLLWELRRGGYDAASECVDTAKAMAAALDRQAWDIVFADYSMPSFDGLSALRLLRERRLDIPFIVVSGTIGEDAAVAAMKAGANDYIMKGDMKRLLPAVERELRESEMRLEGKKAKEQLQHSEERFRQLAETINGVFFMTNADATSMIYVSPAYESVWGRSCQSLHADPFSWLDGVFPEDRPRVLHLLKQNPGGIQTEFRVVRPDGSVRWIRARTFPIEDQKGAVYRLAGIAEDITERKVSEEEARNVQERLRMAVNAARMYTWDWDLRTDRIALSGNYEEMHGLALPEPENTYSSLLQTIHPEDREKVKRAVDFATQGRSPYHVDFRVVHTDGGVRWLETQGQPYRDGSGKVLRMIGVTQDITERKRGEETVRHMAFYDSLTGLPNRNNLLNLLCDAIRIDGGAGRPMALILVNLDRFKEINDILGHDRGDILLKEMAMRLKKTLFSPDVVARLGSDEFAVFLPRLAKSEDIRFVIQKLEKVLQPHFTIEGLPIAVKASVGIALYPEQGTSPDTLFQRADMAMHTAKASTRGPTVYAPEIDRHSPQRLTLMAELRQGIEENQLFLHYQPKVNLKHQAFCGVEALARWRHPRLGMVAPDEFIGLAEETGLIHPLTESVLRMALKQCGQWRRAGIEVMLSSNLSARKLLDPRFSETVAELLDAGGVTSVMIQFEITEHAIMADPHRVQETLIKLREMGIRFSIDDFGIGYSSLGYLQKLPVDQIKVDKSFVIDMIHHEGAARIVRSTIDLAHNLGLEVMAEGVESKEIYDRLTTWGCDAAQGYYIGKPFLAEELTPWLDESPWGTKKSGVS